LAAAPRTDPAVCSCHASPSAPSSGISSPRSQARPESKNALRSRSRAIDRHGASTILTDAASGSAIQAGTRKEGPSPERNVKCRVPL
jgi:hypothetical protein